MQEAKILATETQDQGLCVCVRDKEREREMGIVLLLNVMFVVLACPGVCVLTRELFLMNSDMSLLFAFASAR